MVPHGVEDTDPRFHALISVLPFYTSSHLPPYLTLTTSTLTPHSSVTIPLSTPTRTLHIFPFLFYGFIICFPPLPFIYWALSLPLIHIYLLFLPLVPSLRKAWESLLTLPSLIFSIHCIHFSCRLSHSQTYLCVQPRFPDSVLFESMTRHFSSIVFSFLLG